MDKYKVLLVDDESDMRQLVGMYLGNFGYEWKEAEDGKVALSMLQGEKFDFVILDMMMPEMDGMEVCKEIRKHSDIPIIFLTAKGEEWNRVNGLRIGADDYIVKPFSPGELIARMEAVLVRERRFDLRVELVHVVFQLSHVLGKAGLPVAHGPSGVLHGLEGHAVGVDHGQLALDSRQGVFVLQLLPLER